MKKIGLALGGGGARGCAHIGVIRALQEAGIRIDYIAGTSIGALVGGVYASGGLDELEQYLVKIKWKDVIKQFDPILMKNGMFEGKKVVALLNQMLEKKTFKSCSIPFTAVSTDLTTGKEVHLNSGRLDSAIRASISLPAVFTTVKKESYELMDGGLVNPLPVDVVRKMGADIVIAIDLNHQYIKERQKKKVKLRTNKLSIKKLFKSRYPNMIDVIEGSVFLMQDQITQRNLQACPPDILLNLELGSTSLFDFHKSKDLIKAGYSQMKKEVNKVKKLLK